MLLSLTTVLPLQISRLLCLAACRLPPLFGRRCNLLVIHPICHPSLIVISAIPSPAQTLCGDYKHLASLALSHQASSLAPSPHFRPPSNHNKIPYPRHLLSSLHQHQPPPPPLLRSHPTLPKLDLLIPKTAASVYSPSPSVKHSSSPRVPMPSTTSACDPSYSRIIQASRALCVVRLPIWKVTSRWTFQRGICDSARPRRDR